MTTYWFKPKTHGYGATPSTWQGWVVTIAFVVIITFFSVAAMLAMQETKPVSGYLAWAAMVLGSVYAFTLFAKKRTDGEWAWRWKGQKYADIFDPEKQQSCERK